MSQYHNIGGISRYFVDTKTLSLDDLEVCHHPSSSLTVLNRVWVCKTYSRLLYTFCSYIECSFSSLTTALKTFLQ